MKTTENKLLVTRYTEEVINTGNIGNISEFISPHYVEFFDNKKYSFGIDGAKKHVLGVRETYPDLKLEINQQIAESDWVVTCYTMTGTHSGTWMNMKPTGKRLVVIGVNIDKVVNGKIVEHGGAANLFNAFLEIGVVKIT